MRNAYMYRPRRRDYRQVPQVAGTVIMIFVDARVREPGAGRVLDVVFPKCRACGVDRGTTLRRVDAVHRV
jgi:hypothetical protein